MQRAFLIATAIALLSTAAHAQTVDQQSKDWTVFTHDGLCYIGSTPKKGAQGEKPYVLVTHRAADIDEVSVAIGSPYKPEAPVQLLAGKNRFKLFSQENLAWARDQKTDSKIVAAFKKNATVSVKATTASGTDVTQTYSLSGFNAAHKRMKQLCK